MCPWHEQRSSMTTAGREMSKGIKPGHQLGRKKQFLALGQEFGREITILQHCQLAPALLWSPEVAGSYPECWSPCAEHRASDRASGVPISQAALLPVNRPCAPSSTLALRDTGPAARNITAALTWGSIQLTSPGWPLEPSALPQRRTGVATVLSGHSHRI